MKFQELKKILHRIFREYVKRHIKRILIALVLSIIVAGSTAGIAWLLDPAVKKIFIEQNRVFSWSIPLLIIIAFCSKGLSLYFARINIIRVGEEVAGALQKKIANNILSSFFIGFGCGVRLTFLVVIFPVIILGFTIILQILLGIFTLLSGAGVFISSLHQFSSILLITASLFFLYKNKYKF